MPRWLSSAKMEQIKALLEDDPEMLLRTWHIRKSFLNVLITLTYCGVVVFF